MTTHCHTALPLTCSQSTFKRIQSYNAQSFFRSALHSASRSYHTPRAPTTFAASIPSTQASPAAIISSTQFEGSMRPLSGLSEVAGRYTALLLDQFGVLHDGRRPYPGAVEAVSAAAAAGLRLLIISNSSRRSGGTLDKLAAMGFDRSCFDGVVTSGEMTHRFLTRRPDDWWAGLGSRCLHFNWSRRGPASLEEFGLQVVTDPRDADFFLAHGTEALSLPSGGVEERPLEELKALLCEAAEAAVRVQARPPPLVVANPDVVTVDGDDLVAMPGALAAAYSAAGGPVVLMGKPAPLIYTACGQVLGLPASEILAVGDSLEHDIAGAAAAGIDSLFIVGGIHSKELLRAATVATEQTESRTAAAPVAAAPVAAAKRQHDSLSTTIATTGAPRGGAEELGVVDMAALRQLVSSHLETQSNPGSESEPGSGLERTCNRGPTFVMARFVW